MNGSHSKCRRSRRFLSLGLGLAGVLALTAMPAAAGTYYWDSDGAAAGNNVDGTGLGGAGTWATTGTKWWDGSAGSDVVWPNVAANLDAAIFNGTAGAVSDLNVGSMTIGASGYSFTARATRAMP